MKKILFIMMLISSLVQGQSNHFNYSYSNTRQEWYNGAFRGLHLPGFNGTPSLIAGQSVRAGAVGIDTTNHAFYFYSGNQWRQVSGGGDNNFTSNIIFTNNRLTLSRTGLSDLTADWDSTVYHSFAYYNTQYYPLSSNPANYLVAADIAGKLNASDTASLSSRINHRYSDNSIPIMNALGNQIAGQSVGFNLFTTLATTTLSDNQERYIAVYLDRPETITGVMMYMSSAGSYTGDQNNYIALYTYSAGTMTRVAISANNANLWTASSNTLFKELFTTPYVAAAGVYFVGMLYNQSAQTSAPILAGYTNLTNAGKATIDFTNSAKISAVQNGANTLPTTRNMSALSTSLNMPWVGLIKQ